jgi:hypothetical protein
MLEHLPSLGSDPVPVFEFITTRCINKELQNKFHSFIHTVVTELNEFDMQTGTAETKYQGDEVLPCYTLHFFNKNNTEGIRYCLPVRNEKKHRYLFS